MNAVQLKHGPFAEDVTHMHWPGTDHVVTCGVEDRIALVKKSTDAEWLEVVIAHEETQKTVRVAAERRLKWVLKAVKALKAQCNAALCDPAHGDAGKPETL